MTDLLPGKLRLSISRSTARLTREKLGQLDHVAIFAPESLRPAGWKKLPAGEALLRLQRRIGNKQSMPAAATRLANRAQTGISVVLVPADATPFKRLELARKHVAWTLGSNPSRLGILVAGFDGADADAMAGAAAAAALAAGSPLPSHKSKPTPARRLRTIRLFGDGEADLQRLRAENEGNHLARWLTSLPPNQLDAAAYRGAIEELAAENAWEFAFLDLKALKRHKAGAFLAVAQAGDKNAGIAHLRYRPAETNRPDLALVGKGICFDTGGANLKAARHMQNMHDDMQGSAVALGVLLALTRTGHPGNVDCWLAISENLVSRDAYKPMDVVTAGDGTTIQVIHTDAEGRMVLADTLAMAAKKRPAAMIDFATLTGACVGALTTRYSGAFSNVSRLNPLLIDAGAASGERVWPFPMDDDYDTLLSSDIADIKQCTIDGTGDHILAARFLSRFAGTVPWIHIDLSAGRYSGGLGHIATDVTGFGVRFSLNLLEEQALLDNLA